MSNVTAYEISSESAEGFRRLSWIKSRQPGFYLHLAYNPGNLVIGQNSHVMIRLCYGLCSSMEDGGAAIVSVLVHSSFFALGLLWEKCNVFLWLIS